VYFKLALLFYLTKIPNTAHRQIIGIERYCCYLPINVSHIAHLRGDYSNVFIMMNNIKYSNLPNCIILTPFPHPQVDGRGGWNT